MYKTRLILTLLLTAMLLFASVGTVQAMPPLPSSFYGLIQVQAGDNPPIVGDTVEAYVDGVAVAVGTATIQTGLVYGVNVLGDDPEVPGKDGGLEGDTITFEIDGRVVATATWHSGTNVRLDFHPPDAVVTNTGPVNEGTPVTIDASTSQDSGNDISTYEFDCGNDGTYEIGPQPGATAQCTFDDNGAYTVGVRVIDDQGGQGTDSTTVTVNNVAPTATFNATSPVDEGGDIDISLTAPSDPSSADTTAGFEYCFDCGSGYGAWGTSNTATCPTTDDGTVTVKGKIRDKDLAETEYTADVTVNNVPPTATFNATSPVDEGEDIDISLTAPSDPSSADTSAGFEYCFDCGSGYGTWGTSNTATCPTTDDGTVTVKGKIRDKDLAETEYTADVTVNNVPPTATFNATSPVDEGEDIDISLTAPSDPSSADTSAGFEYCFDCGSGYGAWGTSNTATCPTTDNGTVTVKGKIRDKDLAETEYTADVTVNNVAPTADAGADQTVDEGQTVNFSGSGSDVPADILTYAWDFDYDGSTFNINALGQTPTTSYPDGPASYTVALRVSDDDGASTIDTLDVTVDNVPPTVDAGGPYTGDEGSPIPFSGTASDPGADTLTLAWDFDYDGSTFDEDATGSLNPSHTYADDGPYTVALRVCDDVICVIDTATVTVDNVPPTANARGPYTGNEGSPISFAGTASDPGADTLTYAWDFDYDGTTFDEDNTGSLTPSHTYADDGAYTAALRVCDDDTCVIDTTDVTVNNVPPTVDARGPYSGDEGSPIAFSGTASDPGADTLTYAWDFDYDGTTFDEDDTGSLSPSHTYDDDGAYTAALRVCDDDTCVIDTTDPDVTVNDVLPTDADAGGPYNSTAGLPVNLSGSATCAPVDTCTYEWDLDGDTEYDDATGESPSYTWNTVGDYTIGLRVTDDDGNAIYDDADVHISGATHSIGLELGWNLVSFNLQPVSTAIADVLSSVDGNFDLVYAWDAPSQLWLKYDNIPLSPDTLHNLDEKMGFWIHMTTADALDVVGSVPTTTDIDLYSTGAGWNLVGYPSAVNRDLPGVLEDHGVGTDFSLVYAYHANDPGDVWKLWDRTAWGLGFPQDLTDLSPGWGYWVKVGISDHTWDVDYLAP